MPVPLGRYLIASKHLGVYSDYTLIRGAGVSARLPLISSLLQYATRSCVCVKGGIGVRGIAKEIAEAAIACAGMHDALVIIYQLNDRAFQSEEGHAILGQSGRMDCYREVRQLCVTCLRLSDLCIGLTEAISLSRCTAFFRAL